MSTQAGNGNGREEIFRAMGGSEARKILSAGVESEIETVRDLLADGFLAVFSDFSDRVRDIPPADAVESLSSVQRSMLASFWRIAYGLGSGADESRTIAGREALARTLERLLAKIRLDRMPETHAVPRGSSHVHAFRETVSGLPLDTDELAGNGGGAVFAPPREWDRYAPAGFEELARVLPVRLSIETEICDLRVFPRPSYVSRASGKIRPLWPGFRVEIEKGVETRTEALVRELADRATEATRTAMLFDAVLHPRMRDAGSPHPARERIRAIMAELSRRLPPDMIAMALSDLDARPIVAAFERIAERIPWSSKAAWFGTLPVCLGYAFSVRLPPLCDPHLPDTPQDSAEARGIDALGIVFAERSDPAGERFFACRRDGEWHVLDPVGNILPFSAFARRYRVISVAVRKIPAR